MSKLAKRITALLLSGMLAIGTAAGSVYAAEADVDPGLTSEIAEEVFIEEPVETAEAQAESAQTSEVAEEVFSEEPVENAEAPVDPAQMPEAAPLEEAVSSYTVTLDANGGYFVNEWDDSIGDYVEQAEMVVKQISVGGTVTAVPVYADQDGQRMVFAGWSLERDGEIVSAGGEEYTPVGNCVLYAMWKTADTAAEPEESIRWEETVDESPAQTNTAQEYKIVKEAEDTVAGEDSPVEEDIGTNTFVASGTENEQDIVTDQEAVYDEDVERTREVPSEDIVAEDVTLPKIIESSEEGETVKVDAVSGIVESGTCGDNLTWTLDEEGTLIVSGVGEMANYNSDSAIFKNYKISEVIVEEGVTNIGNTAFYKCSSLTSITIPEGVTSIGHDAFNGCSSLTSITIPQGVTSIGNEAFNGCSSLTSITIPQGVTIIDDYTFSGCSSLTSITIPEGVTSIGYEAFYKCSSLTSITIPQGVTIIDTEAFGGCSSLTSITIPEGVRSIGVGAFRACSSLTSITIPEGVSSIAGDTFSGCSNLTSITIPEGVRSIGVGAFRACSSLTSITIPQGVTIIDDYTFSGCSSLTSITIPEGVTSIGRYALQNCSSLKNITLPKGVTIIDDYTFSGCSSLTSITIPEGVRSIDKNAFYQCSSLTSITIPEEVRSIGVSAFFQCRSLTSITIPEGVTSIDDYTFCGCSNLTSITIPEGVTSIGYEAFYKCSSLTSITIPEGVTSIGSKAFSGCSSLTSITIPEGVTKIGQDVLYECSSMMSIYFNGNAPTTIPYSFYKVTATAYYPANDPTWTEDVRQNYGGTITWVEWDPTSSGEDEKLKIVSTTPTNGDLNVDHALDYFSIQFNEFIAYGNEGYAYLYDASNGSSPVARALIGLGDEEHDNDQSLITGGNTLEIHFPFDVELGHEYYIKIDTDCIKKDTSDINEEGEATEKVYFKGITDNQSWRFKICAVDYMHFGNPTDSIHESAYHVLFTPIKASYIKMIDNGSEGTCFGWSYAVGAKASGYDGINGFGKELKSLEKNSLYGTTDFSFLEYIQYAQLYQNTLDKTIEKWSTENKYNDIFNAIKASINGTGPKIVVNVYGKGGHAVYPLSILEENDSEVLIRVINPNEDFVTGSHYSTLTLKKKDGVINGFEMEGYNKRISYSTVDEVIDDVFSLASEYISDTNMVHSSVPISDSDYYELEPCGEDGTNIQDTHLYWYEGAQVNTSLSADGQIGITDGYKDISVTVGDNADINLNLDEMSAVVESSSDIPSEYEISYKEAISADNIETITVSSSTAGELMGQKTSEGIVVQSSGSEDINVYTDDLSIKASTNGDSVLIKADNNNGIEVLKDPDGDGEYDEQVPVETLSENRIQLVESMVSGIQGKKYTGKEIKQEIILTNENTILDEGADYEVSYTDNINVGTATVTITGKGNYTGIVSKTFTISAVSIANATITGISNRTYTGSAIIQNPTVKVGDQTLTKDTDYTISYANNTKVGTATVKITGKDNYTGTVSKTFKINGIPVSNATVSGISNKTYTGSAQTQNPTVKVGGKTLKKGTDYTISYANNTNVGTATVTITGKGNYASKKTATFKINKAAQSITAKARASRVAVGKTTTVSITGNKGKKSYKSSNTAIATVTSAGKVTAKKVGTVKITATSAATANYKAASKTVTIKVVPAATTSLTAANQATGIKLTWKKVTGANGYKVYRGSTLIKTITSGSTVSFVDKKANTNGTKYTYKVLAKASTGDSTLSRSRVIYRVSRPAVSSVTNSASKKMTVKWGKNAKANGYQIQYSSRSDFKTQKIVTVSGASKTSRTVSGLAKKHKYYVRIRTYKTVGKTKYYSTWSAAKTVTTK